MKKFLKITAAILLLLLIFFVGTFKYRQYSANQVSIPKNTSSIIKISIDEIYKSLAFNMISNPGFYLKSDLKKNTETKISKFDHGLKIPASIYFYTIKNQPKTAIFSRFEIKKLYLFEHFLLSTLHMVIDNSEKDGIYSKSENGNIAVYYNRKYAAIVISNEVANFEQALKDILNQKDFEKIDKHKFGELKNSTEHLSFADGAQFATLNFNSGAINFNNELTSKSIIVPAKPFHRKFNSESAISFWLNADFITTPKQSLKLKNTSLEVDSLAKYYRGYLDFEWINTTHQTDSIITYDYNDDFEKIETVKLKKSDIPNFVFNISADAVGLKNFLNRQSIISLDKGVVNKYVFPLYKVFVGGDHLRLALSTSRDNKFGETKELTNNFFALNVDFLKLNKQINQPLLTRYSKNLALLEVKGRKQENGKIKVDSKVEFVNKDINSLYQLLQWL